ncbi:ArsR/SmtB family transcription factor [Lysobacter arvi]|uniref:Metalloregulator ArsR/SmtB family transcription factor n=1 Tax=Lysobacter arvi TaxID=3038776 RepID=A0ABU1CCF5_9GAMM|nr:metalloregulator ArsR/SmtB family transcription factor [Lysobacter arvi]MDR0181850.1 metalloregulator ArsR/SmtB family transcription factor [Lysobacter arvi]
MAPLCPVERERPPAQATPRRSSEHSTGWLTVDRAMRIFNHMVESHSDRLDAVFRALADPTRRAMVRSLSRQPRSVGELAEPFEISLAAASKHIKVLEGAGLVQRDVQGRTHVCRLDARPLHAGMEWMRHYEQFWNQRLDALETLLRAEDREAAARKAPRKPAAARPSRSTRSKR